MTRQPLFVIGSCPARILHFPRAIICYFCYSAFSLLTWQNPAGDEKYLVRLELTVLILFVQRLTFNLKIITSKFKIHFSISKIYYNFFCFTGIARPWIYDAYLIPPL